MREKYKKQLPLMSAMVDHPHAKQLEQMERILDANPTIIDHVMQDLRGRRNLSPKGAKGMSAEQVLRAAIIKQMNSFSYEELAFHIVDSSCYRKFCKIGIADKGFKSTALCANIGSISEHCWEWIHQQLLGYAKQQGIEKGRKARIDCTVVETNIHAPYDSELLWDVVRVLTRLLTVGKENFGCRAVVFRDQCRRAKRRMLGINYAKTRKQRDQLYADLLKVARKTVSYAKAMAEALERAPQCDPMLMVLLFQFNDYIKLAEKVIDQTHRRVIKGENVAATEKIFSIFEPHTDIIVKDRREPSYGHKICLTGGASDLILDCVIVQGNPADSTLTIEMLDRQREIYDRYPLKVALDGGFASKANLAAAKSRQIKDVCFAKKRGLEVDDMCRSHWVYKQLRRFRAGIESGISWLKRCFGLTRCTWKGLASFKRYVWSSVVAANLLTLSRKQLA
jgi:IS5 family transposase